jgi:hypothetical protein
MERPDYREVLRRAEIMTALAEFDPHVAGTLPLGLDLPTSDMDVLCHAADPDIFAAVLWAAFGNAADFSIRQWSEADRAIIASFTVHGWKFQIFGQAKPISEQTAWRHLLIERRLLDLGGPALRAAVMCERAGGMKTEPAFAALLKLEGDPYRALLDLEGCADESLIRLLEAAGFAT